MKTNPTPPITRYQPIALTIALFTAMFTLIGYSLWLHPIATIVGLVIASASVTWFAVKS